MAYARPCRDVKYSVGSGDLGSSQYNRHEEPRPASKVAVVRRTVDASTARRVESRSEVHAHQRLPSWGRPCSRTGACRCEREVRSAAVAAGRLRRLLHTSRRAVTELLGVHRWAEGHEDRPRGQDKAAALSAGSKAAAKVEALGFLRGLLGLERFGGSACQVDVPRAARLGDHPRPGSAWRLT